MPALVCRPNDAHPPACSSPQGTAKKGRKGKAKAKGKAAKAQAGSDDEGAEEQGDTDTGPLSLPRGCPELASPESAAAAGVAVVASQQLQDAALGLYDSNLSRFPLSEVQRDVLGLVGLAGVRGALQSELAEKVGIANRNFFYVVKVRSACPYPG